MKAGIHPETHLCKVTCTCGNEFEVMTDSEKLSVDLCSACHPFYTGQQKFVDSAGRVDRFAQRYKMDDNALEAMTKAKKIKAGKEKIKHTFNPKARVAPVVEKDDKKADKGGDAAKS